MKSLNDELIQEFTTLSSTFSRDSAEDSSDSEDSVDDRTINNITMRDSITINRGSPFVSQRTHRINQTRDMTDNSKQHQRLDTVKPNSANNSNNNDPNSLRDPQDAIQDALNKIMYYTSQAKAAREDFYRTRPAGSPFLRGPMARPTSNDYMGPWANPDDPVGERRIRPEDARQLSIVTRINSVDNESEGEWIRVRVGVDSCAALSVTPPNVFPQPVEATPQVGEEYMAADKGTIRNVGQQTVNAYTNEYLPVQQRFQVTQVHRPLAAVSEMEDNDKTLVISKYRRFIMDNNTGVWTNIQREDGTYYMDQ